MVSWCCLDSKGFPLLGNTACISLRNQLYGKKQTSPPKKKTKNKSTNHTASKIAIAWEPWKTNKKQTIPFIKGLYDYKGPIQNITYQHPQQVLSSNLLMAKRGILLDAKTIPSTHSTPPAVPTKPPSNAETLCRARQRVGDGAGGGDCGLSPSGGGGGGGAVSSL